jgi:hypothetical protein
MRKKGGRFVRAHHLLECKRRSCQSVEKTGTRQFPDLGCDMSGPGHGDLPIAVLASRLG